MDFSWLWVSVAALAVGALTPWVNGAVIGVLARRAGPNRRVGVAGAAAGLLVSLGLASVALVAISRAMPGRAPAIVLAFMLGLGLARWLRREL